MRLILLTVLTMTAFAANSLLNRLAVESGGIDPGAFAVIRVAAGALMLVTLASARGHGVPLWSRRRITGAVALTAYMVGFSLAYRTLDAGLGALVLFGVVQIAMFTISAVCGAPASARQTIGSGVAFAGLVWVLWPRGDWAGDAWGALFMVMAGTGWAFYTLAGRREADALAATAANFCVALPMTALAVWAAGAPMQVAPPGVAMALLSGAVTSGLGYALWYAILPRFEPAIAAIVQLSVPVIALAGGVALLGEVVTARLLLGAALVIGGIAYALGAPSRR
jgi:drug/metabolite transporter (DMT)-like permease